MNDSSICLVRVVEGSLVDPSILNDYPNKVSAKLDNPNWGNLIEVEIPFGQLNLIQRSMTKHYSGPAPWYMDGWVKDDKDHVVCAFGADDGENGKVFVFRRNDKDAFGEVVKYALSKGIPKDQMDFLEV